MIQRWSYANEIEEMGWEEHGDYVLYADHLADKEAAIVPLQIEIEQYDSAIASRDMEIDRLREVLQGCLNGFRALSGDERVSDKAGYRLQIEFAIERIEKALQPEIPNEPT